MNRLSLQIAFVVAGLALAPAQAKAGVSGNNFNVNITSSAGFSFSDCFDFAEDGTFTTATGGAGTWSEMDFGMFSIWRAEYDAGNGLFAQFTGISVQSTLLLSRGSTRQLEDTFTALGLVGECDLPTDGQECCNK